MASKVGTEAAWTADFRLEGLLAEKLVEVDEDRAREIADAKKPMAMTAGEAVSVFEAMGRPVRILPKEGG